MAQETPEVQADTVEALLENVRMFLKNSDDLASSLHTRGSTLVSFGGVIISIVALLHRDQASSLDLWSWNVLPPGLALLFLLGAVIIVIWWVLMPVKGATIGLSEISKYPTYRFVSQSRLAVQGRTLRGLVEALEAERDKNSRKARGLRVAFIALLVGLVFVTLDAAVLATEDRNDRGRSEQRDDCSRESGRSYHSSSAFSESRTDCSG